jgi:DUF1009 family protein
MTAGANGLASRLTREKGALTLTPFAASDRETQEAKMEIAHKVNVLLVCAAFVFVGALVIGIMP